MRPAIAVLIYERRPARSFVTFRLVPTAHHDDLADDAEHQTITFDIECTRELSRSSQKNKEWLSSPSNVSFEQGTRQQPR
jgi:hypothetical protein